MYTKIEKLFGPVLPGTAEEAQTISVFRESASRTKYRIYGLPGVRPDAVWHLHTPLALDTGKIKGQITGIEAEGHQHDPNRRAVVAEWLQKHQEAASTAQVKKAAAEKKKQAAERKNQAAQRAGEYNAELKISRLNAALQVQVKVDAKGKITLVGKVVLPDLEA